MKASYRILLLLGVILAPQPALAQTAGTIEGIVADPSETPIQGGTVTLTDTATSFTRSIQTDTIGRYAAPGLTPGVYRVETSFRGFRTAVREGVRVSAGRTVRADFSLQIGDLRETIKVTAEVPIVSTSASDWGGTIERTQLAELPLNGRDLFDLASQQPGSPSPTTTKARYSMASGSNPRLMATGPIRTASA